ncbi:uncharacterized protein BXIN_1214 [Babesia sp. Xinjiang]|uniref:uncharacterized protein n=1 Tax=Babesia sp. Xinjiang TaxID=462227 RepID=UPI000A21E94C|nr:uncharacterized protein BXIN_1214 [Babesia sp. Xinjiang]ORM40080.1 hypothetical protein BXIN_1214 [Babesia sp. Xinjiang]
MERHVRGPQGHDGVPVTWRNENDDTATDVPPTRQSDASESSTAIDTDLSRSGTSYNDCKSDTNYALKGPDAASALTPTASGSNNYNNALNKMLKMGVNPGNTDGRRDANDTRVPLNVLLENVVRSTNISIAPDKYVSLELDRKSQSGEANARLKYCGSTMLNANQYREEFLMVTRQHDEVGFRLLYNRYYSRIYVTIIMLYALLLGCSTLMDWNTISEPWIRAIVIMRYVFLLFFTFDLVVQGSNLTNINLLQKPDFLFDLGLLICEIVSLIWLTTIIGRDCNSQMPLSEQCYASLHNLRLWSCIPLFRLYKLCLDNNELCTLSKGILLSIRSLAWTGLFVLMVMYACAIYTTWRFTDVEDETLDEHWGTLLRSMYTLFTIMTLEGWNEVSSETARHYPNSKILFVIFVCFATLTVMNVVTGIILNTFLTSNEKLSGEMSCKGRCDRYVQMSKVFREALNNEHSEGEQNCSSHCTAASFGTCFQDTKDVNGMKSKTSQYQTSAIARFGYGVVSGIRNMLWRAIPFFNWNRGETDGAIDIEKAEQRGVGPPNDDASNQNQDGMQSQQVADLQSSSARSAKLRMTPLLLSLTDQEDLDAIQSAGDNSSQRAVSQYQPKDQHVCHTDSFRSSVPWGSMFVDDTIIDMATRDPCTILSDPAIKRALKMADVPIYQAYEVLKLYYNNGLFQITVTEFATACDRMVGTASGKDLLSFEIAFARRICTLEENLAQVAGKLDLLLERLTVSGVNPTYTT